MFRRSSFWERITSRNLKDELQTVLDGPAAAAELTVIQEKPAENERVRRAQGITVETLNGSQSEPPHCRRTLWAGRTPRPPKPCASKLWREINAQFEMEQRMIKAHTRENRWSPVVPMSSAPTCLLPLDLAIALVEVDGRAASRSDLAIHARQLVEHDFEDVAIIFVSASQRIEPVGEDSAAE